MTIGFCQIDLHLPQSNSLKGKRRILKSLVDRIRKRFNVACAEIAENGKWQKAVLGVACISNGSRHADEMLSKVVDLVRQEGEAILLDYKIELL